MLLCRYFFITIWLQRQPEGAEPAEGVGIYVEPEGFVDEVVHLGRTEHVGGQHAEVEQQEPEEQPVVPAAHGLEPEGEGVAGEGYEVGVGLGTVAEEDDVTHEHCHALRAETEVAPATPAGEESGGEEEEHHRLHRLRMRQQEGLEAAGVEQSHVVGGVVVGGDDVHHVAVERQGIGEGGVEHGEGEEGNAEEQGEGEVAPRTGVHQQHGELYAAIYLGAGGEHDEQHGPWGFAALEQAVGEEEEVAYRYVVLVAEDGLQQHGEEEEEDAVFVGVVFGGEGLDGEGEEGVVTEVPHEGTEPAGQEEDGGEEDAEGGGIEEIASVGFHERGGVGGDAFPEEACGVLIDEVVGVATAGYLEGGGGDGDGEAEPEGVAGTEGGEHWFGCLVV